MERTISEHSLTGDRRGPASTAKQLAQLTEALAKNNAQLLALANAIVHGVECSERLLAQIERISR